MTTWQQRIDRLVLEDVFRSDVALKIAISSTLIVAVGLPLRNLVQPLVAELLVLTSATWLIVAASALAIFYFPEKKIGRYALLLGLMTLLPPGAYFANGLEAPVISLAVIIPPLAAFLIGMQGAIIFGLVLFFSNILLYLMWSSGIGPHHVVNLELPNQLARLVMYENVTVFSTAIAILFERGRIAIRDQMLELQDTHHSGIARINIAGHIVEESKRFTAILGQSVRGSNIDDVCKNFFDATFDASASLLTRVDHGNIEARLKDGRWIELSIKRANLKTPYLFLYLTDITVLKQKHILMEQVAKADVVRSMMITFNHQLNSPLAVALNCVRLIHRTQAISKDDLEQTLDALGRMNLVIKQMSQLAASSTVDEHSIAPENQNLR